MYELSRSKQTREIVTAGGSELHERTMLKREYFNPPALQLGMRHQSGCLFESPELSKPLIISRKQGIMSASLRNKRGQMTHTVHTGK
jgi:hypothetical protein